MRLPAAAYADPPFFHHVRYGEVFAASLAINILSLALPLVTLQVFDRIIPYQNKATLNVLCLAAIVAICIDVLLRLARAYSFAWTAAVFEHTVATNAVRHVLNQDVRTLEAQGVGEYLQRIGSIGKIRDFFSGQAFATLMDLPFVFVFFGLIAYFSGALVLVPLALLIVFTAAAWWLGRKLKRHLVERDSADDLRYSSIVRTLTGIHTVKAGGLEARFERRYEQHQAVSSLANYHAALFNAKAYDDGNLFSNLMMIAIAAAGAPLAISGDISLGTLTACVILSGRIMQPVQKAMGLWTRMQDIEIASQRLKELFAVPALTFIEPKNGGTNEGRLEFKKVCVSASDGEPLLVDIDLKLAPGEAIAITGSDSRTRQAMLKLAAGLYPPTSGQVLVNEIEAHLYPPQHLVAQVGYMAPVDTIFHGTIAENLSRFGAIPPDRVREITALLGIDREIAALPAGDETKLSGAHSDPIPPGLRQRISIARVLAMKPRIFLFDDADRALDKEGYNAMFRLLARLKGRVTMVLVTNDRNISGLADRHFSLENAKLFEQQQSEQFVSGNIADDLKIAAVS